MGIFCIYKVEVNDLIVSVFLFQAVFVLWSSFYIKELFKGLPVPFCLITPSQFIQLFSCLWDTWGQLCKCCSYCPWSSTGSTGPCGKTTECWSPMSFFGLENTPPAATHVPYLKMVCECLWDDLYFLSSFHRQKFSLITFWFASQRAVYLVNHSGQHVDAMPVFTVSISMMMY